MLTAVTFYDVILFAHVFAVIVAFGPTYAYPVFLAVAERTDPRAIPAVGRGIVAWDRIASALLLVILLAGLYLVADGPWSFGDFYVSWGFLAVVILGGLSGMFFMPKSRQLIELAERDVGGPAGGELSAEFHELNRKVSQVGMAAGLLILLTVYVMVAKPFL